MGLTGKTITDSETTFVSKRGATAQRLHGIRLSADEAALLGEYASWCSRERLSPKLFCRDCGPYCEVEVHIDPTMIGIICGHRMLFYEGPVPVVETHHPHAGEMLIRPERIVIPEVQLSAVDAHLIRRYDRFCRIYGLREAMWCGVCEDEGTPAGLRSEVTVMRVSHMCRHANRVYSGMTI